MVCDISNKSHLRTLILWAVVSVVSAMVMLEAGAQTFQYSRGWTNGKRSHPPPAIAEPQVDIDDEVLTIPLSSIRFRPLPMRKFGAPRYVEAEGADPQK